MSVTYEMMVDWDSTNWTSTPSFAGNDDISGYVKTLNITRGKDVELGNSPAGTLDITLNNADRRFTPTYSSSPLYGKIRPWLPVRLRATITGESAQTIYTGFISRISVEPHLGIQEAYLFCTDGMDLLARNMLTTQKDDRTSVTDGAAIGQVLDVGGWPSGKRSIDVDGGSIVDYPRVSEY